MKFRLLQQASGLSINNITMLKIPKKHLEIFYLTLKGTEGELTLSEGRIRDNFMKPLGEAYETFVKERTAIYEEFCDKDKDGKPDIADGNYHFSKKVTAKVNKELTTLFDEEVELKETKGLKEIVERTQYKPKVGEAEVIDEILAKL